MRSSIPEVSRLILAGVVILAVIGFGFLIDRLDWPVWLVAIPALVGVVIIWRALKQEE
jgi:drug/metabolite transporter (DMT)-like permease